MKTQTPPQPKIEFGKCPFCAKQIMLEQNNQAVKLDGYDEFWLSFSTGERMKVAICSDCNKTLTKSQAEQILDAHKEYWVKGIEEQTAKQIADLTEKKVESVNYYNNLSLASYGLKEKDLK